MSVKQTGNIGSPCALSWNDFGARRESSARSDLRWQLAPELPPGALFLFLEALSGDAAAGAEDRAFEMSARQIGASELGVAHVRAQQRRAFQHGSRKIRAAKIGPRKISPAEVAAQ